MRAYRAVARQAARLNRPAIRRRRAFERLGRPAGALEIVDRALAAGGPVATRESAVPGAAPVGILRVGPRAGVDGVESVRPTPQHVLYLWEEPSGTMAAQSRSVRAGVVEVMAAAERAEGRPLAYRAGPRRAGDPPALVAEISRIRRVLRWQPRRDDLDQMVNYMLARLRPNETAWIVNAMQHVDPIQQWGVWGAGPNMAPGNKDGWSDEQGGWVTNTVGFAGPGQRFTLAVMNALNGAGGNADGQATTTRLSQILLANRQ